MQLDDLEYLEKQPAEQLAKLILAFERDRTANQELRINNAALINKELMALNETGDIQIFLRRLKEINAAYIRGIERVAARLQAASEDCLTDNQNEGPRRLPN